MNAQEVDKAIGRVNFKNRVRSILRMALLAIPAAVFGFWFGYSVIMGGGR